jgi:hypothetical protein
MLRRQEIQNALRMPDDVVLSSGPTDAPPLPPIKRPVPKNRKERRAEAKRLRTRRKQ